jgi:hypothetical protein
MKRRYTIRVTCEVFMDPANAKGKAARVMLGSHSQDIVQIGEDGGKLGNVGDADHLAASMETVRSVGKQVVEGGVAKAHHRLMADYPEVRTDDEIGASAKPEDVAPEGDTEPDAPAE